MDSRRRRTVFTITVLFSVLLSQELEDSLALDLDAMWDNTIWNEIEDVFTEVYEVDNITATAGVRGAEAEDEALAHLYYRRSMKGLSKLDLQKALGKLINKKNELEEINPDHKEILKLSNYILQLKYKLKTV